MKFYNQTDLFALLTSAAADPDLRPDADALSVYKEKRLARAVKALRSRNVFLYTEGARTSLNFNDTTTIYTQPAGVRLIITGYGNNMRYGNTLEAQRLALEDFPQMHRLRVVGPRGERRIVDSLTPGQAGVAGEPRYTDPRFPSPFILEADEQLAIDLGYDTAADAAGATMPTEIAAEAFVFFAVRVRDRLVPDDYGLISELRAYVNTNDYQRPVYLNCYTQVVAPLSPVPGPTECIRFSSAIAGGRADIETRPANQPLLITGIATTLGASKLVITDEGDGHSFSLNRRMQSSALMMVSADGNIITPSAPASAPIYIEYTLFPVPHLLRPGATLRADVTNGGTGQTAADPTPIDSQFGNFLFFQGVSA